MIEYELSVEDLADTRFALSPLAETVFSLWPLTDPGRHPLHLPWRGRVAAGLDRLDAPLLLSLVGPTRALPDFLTPRPTTFAPTLDEELERVRRTPTQVVRRDLLAAHAPEPPPAALRAAATPRQAPVHALLEALCAVLQQYWDLAVAPHWSRIRVVLEADMTYRGRRLATGGARLLFADMHPNLRWNGGAVAIDKMIGRYRVAADGRGLLLVPSVFAYKPVPPISADEPPWLTYPARGVGSLWVPAPPPDAGALARLLGPARATLLRQLSEPTSTAELARRLRVTPSAVSQHLQVLHTTNLVTRARNGRHVLYQRSPLGDHLTGPTATSCPHPDTSSGADR